VTNGTTCETTYGDVGEANGKENVHSPTCIDHPLFDNTHVSLLKS
jgi:hypothetical protein